MHPELSREDAVSIFCREHPSVEPCASEFFFANINEGKHAWRYEIPLKSITAETTQYVDLLAYDNRDGAPYTLRVPVKYLQYYLDGLVVNKNTGTISLELSANHLINWFVDITPGGRNIDFSMFIAAQPGDRYSFDGLLRKRVVKAILTQSDISELYDPIEDEPSLRPIFAEVAAEIERAHRDAGIKCGLGYCFQVWDDQARILLERFGIIWYSPSQMNPSTLYD